MELGQLRYEYHDERNKVDNKMIDIVARVKTRQQEPAIGLTIEPVLFNRNFASKVVNLNGSLQNDWSSGQEFSRRR